MLGPLARPITLAGILVAFASCSSASSPRATPTTVTTTTSSTTASTTAVPTTTTTTTVAPTTTVVTEPSTTTTPSAGFAATITTVTTADLASSYHAGCPIGPDALRRVRMSYWGFDNRPHLGTIVVSAAVTNDVVTVFGALFRAHFPIRRMQTVDAFDGDDQESMAADNTSGFNCRYVDAPGTPRWSAHAYGQAIDINTVENPYVNGSRVEPPAAAAYLDRGNRRPGMAGPGTALNDAFASVGWFWGGRWSAPDYQHFSKTGG